jgi:pilus assembly protein Flp/PilA
VFSRFVKCDAGATAIEYGLIAALIAVAIIGGLGNVADSLDALWGDNNSNVQDGLNG